MSEGRYLGRPCKYGHPGLRFTNSRQCIECSARKGQEYYATKGRAKAAARHRLNKYGITPADFEQMLVAHGGRCRICTVELDVGGMGPTGLAVDHSHTTGAVRGLLCNNCNRGLGMFRDNPALLSAASTYLIETKP